MIQIALQDNYVLYLILILTKFLLSIIQVIIFRFIQSCTSLDVYDLPVRVEEERATTFERKDGFNYFVRLNYIYFDFAQKKKKIRQFNDSIELPQSWKSQKSFEIPRFLNFFKLSFCFLNHWFVPQFVIVDWKKNNRGMAQQHLHLAFKQSNSSIYVYDHGPLSGKYFTIGDRIIDIDGITFIRAVDLRDRILWSHHNKVRMPCINAEYMI